MQLRNSAGSYGAISQCLHWCTVALVIVAWALGTFDDVLPKGAARATGLFVHISAGLAILAVLAARVLWRTVDPPPPAEPTILGAWGDRASRFAHYALYALLVAVVTVGIVLQFARGEALPLLGLAEVPSPWTANRAFARSVKEAHEVLANALVILAALHAAAAFVHHWVLRDRTLVRMLPGARRHDQRSV
ncbi:MAG TPA: cytochrome b [Reyranella sp.]|nr:cytochrome b [Reyranella sp.]